MKSFLSVRDLGPTEMRALVEEASRMRDVIAEGGNVEKALAGKCVANLFFETSTRTRLSFDLAAQYLGANVITFNPETASTAKGESLRDTVMTVASIGADVLVVRHREDGMPRAVSEWTGVPVVNAGDGTSEHPTQALVDVVTMQRHFGELDGIRLGVVGDISHSRVAGSLVGAVVPLGVEVTLIAPNHWLPLTPNVRTSDDLDSVIAELDIVYLLRVQTERGGEISDEYIERFQLDRHRLARLGEKTIVMHPGPINRGVELSDDVADSPRSHILEQVRNGVPSRIAVLRALVSA
jgi:aspartate carbamoyltransferase catalytic subunit